jgi:hypothetical protein
MASIFGNPMENRKGTGHSGTPQSLKLTQNATKVSTVTFWSLLPLPMQCHPIRSAIGIRWHQERSALQNTISGK